MSLGNSQKGLCYMKYISVKNADQYEIKCDVSFSCPKMTRVVLKFHNWAAFDSWFMIKGTLVQLQDPFQFILFVLQSLQLISELFFCRFQFVNFILKAHRLVHSPFSASRGRFFVSKSSKLPPYMRVQINKILEEKKSWIYLRCSSSAFDITLLLSLLLVVLVSCIK